jgi:2-oxoglutarate dehydrogenase E1 component
MAADGYNAGVAEELYERSLRERGVVPPSLAEWAGDGDVPARPAAPAEREASGAGEVSVDRLRVAAAAGSLVAAHRDHGHLAARLDPLADEEPGVPPVLQPGSYGIEEPELAGVPASVVGLEGMADTLDGVLAQLREIYCGTIGYELDHVDDPGERDWLLDRIESGRYRDPLDDRDAVELLERLSEVEGLERFLHRAYLGKKRFSVEGVDMLVPMLDDLLRRGAAGGVRETVLGMAHRGRLNVLAHIIGRPYRAILAEFEQEREKGVSALVPDEGAGDVKYHLGAAGTVETEDGLVDVFLAPNPSHLEHVNPVVQGMARAARDLRGRGERGDGGPDEEDVLPVIIHGDAAFMGEGVVAETLNLSELEAYETGGTVHVIANNQLGFTTEPEEGRSTRYASDLAMGYRVPVLHVNADDPEACLAATRLALDYRAAFGNDIVIDLVGYRRHGHNEGDEPAYTQPSMYRKIDDHPTVRDQWRDRLEEDGLVDADEAEEMADRVDDRLGEARESLQDDGGDAGTARPDPEGGGGAAVEVGPAGDADGSVVGAREREIRGGLTRLADEGDVETGVPEDRLRRIHGEMLSWPDDLEVLGKLAGQMEKRRASLEEGEPLDWARAEMLAFGSLVTEGVAVRLSGEDSVRGTFSQRHLTLHDADGERSYTPLANLSGAEAPFEAYNSPLSEVAPLGFEYGYSAVAADSLVMWEAQFGDFANVGQAIIDQFIVAGRSKWGQESSLVLLLPHGYEGQGPEHSSARPERFLQLAAENNVRVAYPTTPAQHFHLLRRQALRTARRPLVVMTPKSLLRHPDARSPLPELVDGGFRPVLPDPDREAEGADALLLCTGKVYYDLVGSDAREEAGGVAVARLERLYPFPGEEVADLLEAHGRPDRVAWVQEEPANMGAWPHVRPRLRELVGGDVPYVGRPAMASPAEGYADEHEREQSRIVRDAFGRFG